MFLFQLQRKVKKCCCCCSYTFLLRATKEKFTFIKENKHFSSNKSAVRNKACFEPNVHHQRGQLLNIYRTSAGKNRYPPSEIRTHDTPISWKVSALTTELPRQPQRSESNISCKGNIDYPTFAPRPLGLGITSVGRRDTCSSANRACT